MEENGARPLRSCPYAGTTRIRFKGFPRTSGVSAPAWGHPLEAGIRTACRSDVKRRLDRVVHQFEFSPCHSGARAQPASPESMNTNIEYIGNAGVHGFRARPSGPSRN